MAIRASAYWENPPVCASRLVAVVAVVAVSSDGAGEWAPVAACGQIGCNCGAFAPYFFGFSRSLFKGVKIMEITLNLTGLSHCK